MTPKALLFDVFGTLVDWRTSIAAHVSAAFAEKGYAIDGPAFADAWRAEYEPAMESIRAGRRDYVPLDDLHRETLMIVLATKGLEAALTPGEIVTLARAWERLVPWPDVRPGLAALKARTIIAPCSNGAIALMTRLARHAGLPWDAVLGADLARDYKPKPAVYRAACAALRLEPDQVMMVAAHPSDLAGAREAGLATAFFPRPDEYGRSDQFAPEPVAEWDINARDLADLAKRLG